MLKGLIGKVVGDPNEREIRKIQPLVDAINSREPEMERRTDAELRSLTDHFRSRLASGETLDDLVEEAFAAIREVAKRTVDMRPFDVQLIGGIVLHRGMVAEMRTGEGKTLVATMPVYLNALSGRGVHLVTVNDYLARRDAQWMGPIYTLMGLSVGLLQSGPEQPAYVLDPDYQRDLRAALKPVAQRLLNPLKAIFHDELERETARALSAVALADFAADKPRILAELVAEVCASQYDVLFGAVAGCALASDMA